jgi:hypothetical protein
VPQLRDRSDLARAVVAGGKLDSRVACMDSISDCTPANRSVAPLA